MILKNRILKVLLTPLLIILSVIFLPLAGKPMWFMPLIFFFFFSFMNLDYIKIKSKPTGILIAIAQSYSVFIGLSIVIYAMDLYIPEIYLGNNDFDFKGVALVTFGGYLAGLMLFYFYSFLFKIQSLKFGFVVISICFSVVVLVMQLFTKNEFLQFGVEKFTSFLISWLIFMSLAYSFSMNYSSFRAVLNNKTGKN